MKTVLGLIIGYACLIYWATYDGGCHSIAALDEKGLVASRQEVCQ